jgi:hypothetical protein
MATWTTIRKGTGTKYETEEGKVVVQRHHWTRPGFRTHVHPGTGWVILVNGQQLGPAHPTATKAKAHAELPGVWADIQKQLA